MQIEELLARLDGVKQSGQGWTARCSGHDDGRNSLQLSVKPDGKINIHCHAGCKADNILGPLGWTASDLYPPNKKSKSRGEFVCAYDYVDFAGTLVFQTVRLTPKDFRQRRPAPGGGYAWSFAAGEYVKSSTGDDWYRAKKDDKGERVRFPALKNRPLYNLPALLAKIKDGKAVFLVEGEKDADSVNALGPFTATTNAGGAEKWEKAYTKLLHDAKVAILPDYDHGPGRKRAEKLLALLPSSRIIELPDLEPGQKDITDWLSNEGNDAQRLGELTQEAFKQERIVSNTPNELETKEIDSRSKAYSNGSTATPFIPLGYNNGQYYFLSKRSGQVVALAPRAFSSKPTFFTLAPLPYWENSYGGGEGGVNYMVAADALISQCHTKGIFDMNLIRGRGAWWDKGRTVLHQGDRLTVDGVSTELIDFETDFLYPKAKKLNIPHEHPAGLADTRQLAELLNMLNWERPLAGKLLAGWIAIAPICGVLAWRPHVWVTGPSGSGKSWVTENVVGPILGDMALNVLSVTTEAGIRQALGQDALPVTFDEIEGDDKKTMEGIQRVLELARQASSADGGSIIKGTAAGAAMRFDIKSMFYMSSIGVSVRRRADETRVTVLSLLAPPPGEDGADRFKEIEGANSDLMNRGFPAALIARSCQKATLIRANARTLSVAISRVVSSKRTGDQLGSLLSGHMSLTSDDAITDADAIKYVVGLKLAANGFVPDQSNDDGEGCLRYLMEQRILVEMTVGPSAQRTVGELLDVLTEGVSESGVGHDVARETLKRYGISTIDGALQISTRHSGIAKLLEGTSWAVGWATYLKRIDGAESGKRVRFGSEGQTRVVTIPWKTFEATENDVEGKLAF